MSQLQQQPNNKNIQRLTLAGKKGSKLASFSTHCFRDFKQFIGELTASTAGIHSAVLYTANGIREMNNDDPWAEIAATYNVKVNGLNSGKVLKSASRLNIVSIYSGFDLFLSTIRKEFYTLQKIEWKAEKSDTPFDEFQRNIDFKNYKNSAHIMLSQIDVIDYYRLARNAIVHPSQDNKISVQEFFTEVKPSITRISEYYKMRSAPNKFDEINFHDVKLAARIFLDFLPIIDVALDPGDERLKELIPFSSWARYKPNRQKNAAIGFLRQNYGISRERAEKILAH